MSQPNDHVPGPPPDPLVAGVMRATRDAAAGHCPDAEVLALYVDGAANHGELARVAAHLPGCSRCQAIVAAYVRASADAPADVPGLEGGHARDAMGFVNRWLSGWRWFVPVASVAAVALVAVWIGRGPADQVAVHDQVATQSAPPQPTALRDAASPAAEPGVQAAPRLAPAAPAPAGAARSEGAPGTRELRRDAAATGGAASAAVPEAIPPPPPAAMAAVANEREYKAEAAKSVAGAAAASPAAGAASGSGVRDESRARGAMANAASPAETATAQAADAIDPRATARLSGTVTYQARMALPAGAVIDVQLNDVSRVDAPARTLARARIVTRGEQVPVPFTLRYAPDAIEPRGRYQVQVRITVDGRLAWVTATAHPVFADGAATTTVTVVVEPVR